MTRYEYIKAVDALIQHDTIICRVRDVSSDLAREVGDDFGGLAIIPETPLRRAYIQLIDMAVGDKSDMTSYLIDEAMNMPKGGSITLTSGKKLPITNADECWLAIVAMRELDQ